MSLRHLLQTASTAAMSLAATLAYAQSSTPPAAASDSAAVGPSLGPLLLAMLLVVALIPVAIWMLKRLGPAQHAQVAGLKIVAQLPLGPRERIVVLEAGERWLLLGVTPTTITRIGTLPKGEQPPTPAAIASFASLLSAARGRSDAK
jgi:flagellar protein FliO/FliZ